MIYTDYPLPKYRPDIDGLRAIAVIFVVLFHADFGFAKGGFIGVDIFFVISGFLISSILLHEFSAGPAGFLQFYQRRARRIIPAITVMVAAVLISGIFLFPPNQFLMAAKAALATLLFGANFFFWRNSSYFAPESALNPLTHMWSLGVEEQFYLIFPICLWFVLRFFNRSRLVVILIGLMLSFGLGWWLTFIHPPSAFYLLPARAWQLLLGCALALVNDRLVLRSSYRQAFGLMGILLIGTGLAVIDNKTLYPGFHALLPSFGTAALLVAGGRAGQDSIATRMLLSPFLVATGLRSYSIYLWHWPILVWTRTAFGDINLGLLQTALAMLCTLIVAEISYRFIERPFRERSRIAWPTMLYSVVAASLLIAAAAIAVIAQKGMAWRFSPQVVQLDADSNTYPVQSITCFNDTRLESFARIETCTLGARQKRIDFVLWGDSHAGAIAPSLSALAQARDKAGYLAGMSSCPPFRLQAPGIQDQNAKICAQNNRYILRKILSADGIHTVFLFASWQSYYDEEPDHMAKSMIELSAMLKKSGKTIILIHGMPRPDIEVPWVLARHTDAGKAIPVAHRPNEPWLKMVAANSAIISVNLSDAFCIGQACALSSYGRALYVDGAHLSQPANDLVIAPWLAKQFPEWPSDSKAR